MSNKCFHLKQVITFKSATGEVVAKPSTSCQVVVALRLKETKNVCRVISGQRRFMLTKSRRAKNEDLF